MEKVENLLAKDGMPIKKVHTTKELNARGNCFNLLLTTNRRSKHDDKITVAFNSMPLSIHVHLYDFI